jgi:CRP-like cAMP-binding protein
VLRAGDLFGELAILDGGTRSATVTALEPTLLLAIDRRKLHALLQKEPTVSYKLLTVLARRLRKTIDAREGRDVPARLAKLLVRLADEDGEVAPGGGVRLRTELSQRELGAMIGATRESVNKNVAVLVKRGAVRTEGKQLVVDVEKLRSVAEGDRERR